MEAEAIDLTVPHVGNGYRSLVLEWMEGARDCAAAKERACFPFALLVLLYKALRQAAGANCRRHLPFSTVVFVDFLLIHTACALKQSIAILAPFTFSRSLRCEHGTRAFGQRARNKGPSANEHGTRAFGQRARNKGLRPTSTEQEAFGQFLRHFQGVDFRGLIGFPPGNGRVAARYLGLSFKTGR